MFSHIMVGSNDVDRSKKFYDGLFAVLGMQPATSDARRRLAYSHNGGRFMVSKPIDGKPASGANGGTIESLMACRHDRHQCRHHYRREPFART
jgi:catechol 2,3-dioxygenase-like lactoylglutathione lyase family enzyme